MTDTITSDYQDYYCYALTIDGKPFYIGQGRGPRYTFHQWCAGYHSTCTHNPCAMIRAMTALGHSIDKYKFAQNLCRQDAIDKGIEMIAYGKEQGWPLINKTIGGLGQTGYKQDPEDLNRRSAVIRETWKDESLRSLQSKRQAERWSDPEERAKQRARMNDPVLIANNKAKNKGHTRKALTYPGFIAPDGTVYAPVHNLALFCSEHKLQKSNMCLVASGKQAAHKGWTLYRDKPQENI